jgi:hypothetical protein
MEGPNLGALLGKAGDEVFYIGLHYRGGMPANGVLFLGIQDEYSIDGEGGLNDNDGTLSVIIQALE